MGYQSRMGENEEFSLNNGAYSIGFSQEQSVSDFTDYVSLHCVTIIFRGIVRA